MSRWHEKRSHISQTITNPSESLLNELRIVEDMKKDCDDKRTIYELMKAQYDKGRMKGSKGEHVSSRQLQLARDEFDEQATLFIFRMKSLKRGQSRSLLTQAARHYAAQMSFFRKALKSLETIEPHVKLTTEQQHIDYLFSGLEDDDRDSISLSDDEDDKDDSDAYSDTPKDDKDELNNESHTNVMKNEVSTSGNPMELEDEDVTFPSVAPVNAAEVNMYGKPIWNSAIFDKTGSKSAPIMLESTLDPYERSRQMRQSSTRRLNTYVLPTPLEKSSVTSKIETQQPQPKPKPPTNMWHSLPFEKISEPIISSKPTPLPAPQVVVRSPLQVDPRSAYSAKKIKRYAFSGPLAGDAQSKQPLYASGPIGSTVRHPPVPRSVSRTTLTQPLSSLSASVSVPKISELHELPRPPPKMASKKTTKVGFSAPLVTFKHGPDLVDTNKLPVSDAAYTLPVPSGSHRDAAVAKQTQTWDLRTDKSMVSPPLSPITLKNNYPTC
ncbi:putative arfaptin homology domain/BAR domain protein [Tanacetum coccineum]|uniref:Arfaptin homology domain/BAR domain protein n=1 Tax=Tanacetum coccineum TaxID=301880 RepID=A0ABQ5I123_9ASTR